MESVTETEAGINDEITGQESRNPVTVLTVKKVPQGSARRLVLISKTAAAVALLSAIVSVVVTSIMVSRDSSTSSKNCTVANEIQAQNSKEIHNVSAQNLLRRIEDLENKVQAMEASMVATVDGVWFNMTNSHEAFENKLQAMHNRLRDSLTAVNATLNNKLNNPGSSSSKPAANFSTCKHRSMAGIPITATSTSDESLAFYREPKGQRAVGITCSTDYGHYKLSKVTQGSYDFKCSCRGVSSVFGSLARRMRCYIHVWECPI